jgi:hypothetical protein
MRFSNEPLSPPSYLQFLMRFSNEPLSPPQQGRNVEVGQPSVAAIAVGTEADPTSYFDILCSIFDIHFIEQARTQCIKDKKSI